MLSLHLYNVIYNTDVTDSRSSSFGITTSEELKETFVVLNVIALYFYVQCCVFMYNVCTKHVA